MIVIEFQVVRRIFDDVAVRKKSGWGGRREGAGRPSEVQDPVRFTFDLERADMETLRALSEQQGISTARLVRDAVRRLLRGQRSK